MEKDLHSPVRRLIELRMENADLDSVIDTSSQNSSADDLVLRRLKKRRLAIRDEIARLEAELEPPSHA